MPAIDLIDLSELLAQLRTSPHGLTAREAAQRRAPVGQASPKHRRTVRLLLRQFISPIMLILIGAAAISIAVSDPVDGIIILSIIMVSGILGFVQEWRAAIAMEDLLNETRVHADVLRDRHETEVLIADVVEGDVIVLRAGDLIPADMRILESERLLVDESVLTGEPIPQEKGGVAPTADDPDVRGLPASMLYFGSHVVSGTATGVAVAVGHRTRFGATVRQFESRDVRTQFEKDMTAFGLMLTRVVAVLVVVVVGINLLLDRSIIESLMFALAVAVGITPQLLPAITTVSLSLGARRMARDNVLVKRLDAIEDIGAMSILCCDKTGTLTTGIMELDTATDPEGRISDRVLQIASLNAGLQTGYPNALDAAIIRRTGPISGRAWDELPYDFQRRRLSVLAHYDGASLLITKGAVTSVANICSQVASPDGLLPLDALRREALMARLRDLSARGLRVLAVATRHLGDRRTIGLDDESEMTLEGLLVFSDPATPDAATSLIELRELGIDVALITGDNVHIAKHVGGAVGFPVDNVVTGQHLAAMSEAELRAVVANVRVFAEVDPEQKEALVHAFRASGATVGFLGDGINDSAALRAADVGISVDGASDAAKHAAALVILTKDLAVIADGVRLGRTTFSNTLKYIRVTISANFGNMVSLVVASAFLPFLPLLPVQILSLNLLSDVPALTIASDRVDAEETAHPRGWGLPALRRFMIVFGLASTVIDLAAFALLTIGLHATEVEFHSTWFALSVVTECLALLVLRTAGPLWRSRPSMLLALTAIGVMVLGVVIPFTFVGSVIGFAPLPLAMLALVGALSLGYVLVNEALKMVWRRRSEPSTV